MDLIPLRPNAAPVYVFLSRMAHSAPDPQNLTGKRILDCGAGGPLPPLSLFAQHGLDCWGIDTSLEQLEKARQFCQSKGLEISLERADMRRLPFEGLSFDYVFEHFAICHLTKLDTARALREMGRVLKPGGMLFWGLVSDQTWPLSIFGQEVDPGEYLGKEHGDEQVLHSVFSRQEAQALVKDWAIIDQFQIVRPLTRLAEDLSREDWEGLYEKESRRETREEWLNQYHERTPNFQYAHWYFILRKQD